MATVNTLQTQDTILREQFTVDPEAVEVSQIDALLNSVQKTGEATSSIQDREQLIQILQHWAPIIEEKTGKHPGTNLATYDPDMELDEEETAVVPTTEDQAADVEEEATLTYIPGEPQEGQPQTLAQLFMTMPTWARIVILVIIALILASIIFWIVSPKSDEPEVNVTGTETVVAAAITASAQPTGTNTPTATPVIYIQSETAVAESAPIGSPTPIIHVVQKGDTLNSVSRKYGIPVQDITVLNNIYNANSISVGQELLIPTPGPGTRIATAPVTADATSATQQVPATSEEPSQVNSPSGEVSELVIRSTKTVAMRIAAGSDYQAIADLTPGTFASIVARTPDNSWYLIQLEDGFTRGWVPADETAILYPANPNTIPTTPMP